MSAKETSHTTVESREKERQRIADQVRKYLNTGGEIKCIDSHLASVKFGPGKAMGSEAGVY
jgi:hypothetical protein